MTTQLQTLATQVSQLADSLTGNLSRLGEAFQQGLADSGKLLAAANESASQQIGALRETLAKIHKDLGEFGLASRNLSAATETIQRILGAAQKRGSLGEVVLERLLEDALPREHFELQYRFRSGETVDAVVRFQDKLLPIDSKFPRDAYLRIQDEEDRGRKEFSAAVRSYADSIARKYILPGENTLDIALMFVPSESVYYELLITEAPGGIRLDEYCRTRKVIPVSPNTLYAYLSVILLGLRGMKIEENARRLLATLSGLEQQFGAFAEVYDKLGTHLRHAQQSYEEASRKFEHVRSALEQIARGALSSQPAAALEPARKGLLEN